MLLVALLALRPPVAPHPVALGASSSRPRHVAPTGRLGGDFRARDDDDDAQARERTLRSNPPPPRRTPPIARRARVSTTDAGTLLVEVPPKGLAADAFFSGAFSVAWFSAVVPATVMSGGVAPFLFMLPFWAAGGLVAKSAVLDPFVSSQLSIGQFAWSLRTLAYGDAVLSQREGATDELRGAQAELVAYVNEIPQYELRLYSEGGMCSFGSTLSVDELEFLADEINQHLEGLRRLPSDDS
ncbi:hypothetical protein AB1Y20_001075 [Prymnesium parvum]|uniref:Uncharacterized protein n=1 Tax=Prymnesium parvum TaxID=97485 RepID=A0AB34K6P0_PRYPA